MARLLSYVSGVIVVAALGARPQEPIGGRTPALAPRPPPPAAAQRSQTAVDDARLPDPLYPNVIALWEGGKPGAALTALERQVGSTDGDAPVEAIILQARLRAAAGEYDRSADLWDQIRARERSLASVALRAEADSLVRAGKPDRAVEIVASLPGAQYGDLLAMIATAYRVDGRLDRAAALYRRVLANPPSAVVSDDASLGLALSLEQAGDPAAAISLLRNLQLRFRQPATFARARAQARRLASAFSRTVEPFTEHEYQSLTDRLRNLSAYDDALAVLEDWRRTYPASADRIEALIVDTLYRARRDDEADARAEEFLKTYPDTPQVPDIRVLQYRLDVREGRTAGVRSRGRALWSGQVTGVSLTDRLSLARLLAAYLVSVGELSEGFDIYQQLYRESAARDMRIDVLWRAGVTAIRAGHLERAEDTFRTLRRLNPGPDTSAIADYWTAVIDERRNRRNEALRKFTALAERRPYDYYGLRARERLEALNAAIPQPDGRLPFPPLVLQDSSRTQLEFRGAELLARAGLKPEAAQMARALATDVRNNPALALLAARASADAGEHRQALRLVETRFGAFLNQPADGLPDDFWTLAFPRAFWSDVQPASESAHVDPLLLLSLARQESRFDPSVRSAVGALGLFQLMPYTADRLAPRVGIAVTDRAALFQARVASAYAAQLVGDLLKEFDDDAVAVMAAYNAGEDRTRDWWKAARDVTEDLFVDTIPYTETRTYVRSVYTNYVMYQQLYGRRKLNTAP